MQHVTPAIIPKSLAHLEKTLASVKAFAEEVQIDIVDGVFVPFTSWPYHGEETLESLKTFTSTVRIEADLMIKSPERVISEYVWAGVRDIVVHLESTEHFDEIVRLKEELGFRLGLSIGNDSPLPVLLEKLPAADYVQFMGIAHIGSQGQPFDERVLEYIRSLHALEPHIEIAVDGSVNEDTIPLLRGAGAKRFIAGSAILGAKNPKTAHVHLETLAALVPSL